MPEIIEFMLQETPAGKVLRLGVDDDGWLYVNGEPVKTEHRATFELWVKLAVIVGSLGAFAQGFVSVYGLIW